MCIQTNKLDESTKLLNLFFSFVIGNNLTQPLGDTPDLKYQMLMLMDEFTAMGRVDVWAKRISISASFGVRSLVIVQSRAQLRSAYGDNDAQNFITNHGAQIVFAPREQSDANEYSEMLGYKTIRKEHGSISRGRGTSQVSINHTEEKRALFLPQEIKELPADDEIIFYEGSKPTRAKKNWYFKDPMLTQRASLPPVEITRTKQENDDMSSKTIQLLSATAALALAATSLPSSALDAPASASSAAPSNAALIEQAKQDGLTIEQERYIQSVPKTPGYHWDGYSDKPVEARFGPNKFMFPMNLYFDQFGPDFQGGVTLGLYWPDFNPPAPGDRRADGYFEKYQNKLIDITVDYVDRIPIDTALLYQVNENPDASYKPDTDDPSEHLKLRIKSELVFGLTPYYTDMPRLKAYFDKKGYPRDQRTLTATAMTGIWLMTPRVS